MFTESVRVSCIFPACRSGSSNIKHILILIGIA